MIERDTGFDEKIAGPDSLTFLRGDSIKSMANRPMDVHQLKDVVHDCIGKMLVKVEEQLGKSLTSKYESVQSLVSSALSLGGKRLRPMLTLLSSQAVTSAPHRPDTRDHQDLIRVATAVELVHTASLAHDDVMDHAENRRHQPTIGSLAGNSAAILVGDFLFTKAYATAAGCRSPLVARRIAAASTQLCEGELRQQLSAGNWQLTTKEYRSILMQKTASLCSTSCRLGAWQVGAPISQQKSLQRFGRLLGLAFQIYDDWLDYWGGSQTGKTLGTDLAERKPTLPVMFFLRTSDRIAQRHFLSLVSSSEPNLYAEAMEMVRNSEAGSQTLQTAHGLATRSLEELRLLPESPARSALEAIALFSVRRTV